MAENTEIIMTQIKTYGSILKYAGMAALLTAVWYVSRPATPAQPAAQPVGQFIAGSVPVGFNPAVPQAAPAAPAATQTVTFTVASVGRNRNRTAAYLNSQQSYKAVGNQSIQLTGPAAAMAVETLVGRTVTATGQLSSNGAVSIIDPSGLQVR